MKEATKTGKVLLDVLFEEASESDIPELTKVMKRAYDDDHIRFRGDPNGGGPPGYDDGSCLRKWGFVDVAKFFKIVQGDQLIGGFVLFVISDEKNVLGIIFVDPAFQDQGIGTKAMEFMFSTFPAKQWELGTPEWSARNHHFYEKNGFEKVGERWDSQMGPTGAYEYLYEKQ
jgi:GNAT superfamily N-acetyltransferase